MPCLKRDFLNCDYLKFGKFLQNAYQNSPNKLNTIIRTLGMVNTIKPKFKSWQYVKISQLGGSRYFLSMMNLS